MSLTSVTSLRLIENSGPNNLHDRLLSSLDGARQTDIAVAFITDAGLAEVLPSLRRVASVGKVRVITGLYQAITEPKALRTLLRAQKETRGNLSVRLSTEPKFHRKLYITQNKSVATAIVGSSNLTREGLISGGELSVAFTFSKASKTYRSLSQAFEKDWKHHSIPLSDAQIGRYEKYYHKNKKNTKLVSLPLKKILGKLPIHQKGEPSIDKSVTLWRDSITGFAKKRTEQIIGQQTNWDEKNYVWYSAGKHNCNIHDELLMFDFTDNFAYLSKITDTTEAGTPDGRYFIAFKQMRNTHKKRLVKPFWNRLKTLGIIKNRTDANSRRKISQLKWDKLREIFIKT